MSCVGLSKHFRNINTSHIMLRAAMLGNPIACYFGTSSKSIEERLGMPPRPKKPLTPYFRYMKDTRLSVKKQHPNASLIDIVKIVAKKWEEVDGELKVALQECYKKDQIAYVEERAVYDSKITDDQKRELMKMRKDVANAKQRRVLRKRIKELGRPKKPPSAFLNFIIKERSKGDVNNQSYKDWHRKVCEKWSRLSEEEKNKMKEESKDEMRVYKQNISKWEEQMIRLGHVDVVRQEAMVELKSIKTKTPKISAS